MGRNFHQEKAANYKDRSLKSGRRKRCTQNNNPHQNASIAPIPVQTVQAIPKSRDFIAIERSPKLISIPTSVMIVGQSLENPPDCFMGDAQSCLLIEMQR